MTKEETLRAMVAEIRRRSADYDARDVLEERANLIEKWPAAHPEAAAQPPSERHHPLEQFEKGDPRDPLNHPEYWENDIYQVTVRRWTDDKVFGTNGGMIQIGINALDGTARHDWREFQWIKKPDSRRRV